MSMRDHPPLEIVTGGRRSGKTMRMLFWMQDNPGSVMVVYSEDERSRILSENPWLESRRLLTPDSAQRLRGLDHPRIGIDNLDMILSSMFGPRIEKATMTDEVIVRKTRIE